MINEIVSTFSKQALEHRSLQAFYYNRNYELGSGKDKYPLFWLEDPMQGRNQDNLFVNSINFSILFLPNAEHTVSHLQGLAFSAGLNIIERIKQDAGSAIRIRPDWSYITLQDYYDDKACGCRFSVNLVQANMQNLCLIEEQFDAQKQKASDEIGSLPNFELFANKLPIFNLRTHKE